MTRMRALLTAVSLLALGSEPRQLGAQAPPPQPARTDSAPAKKLGRFGRLRATLLPGTTYAGRLIAPILTEAQEKGVPGLHVQNAIHEFTGPAGDYPALAEGPANALAERLRKLIHDESGQQGRVSDSIGSSATAMMAALTGGATTGASSSSGLQLPPDVAGALRSGKLVLNGIKWANGADLLAFENALGADLKGVAAEMMRLGGVWRVDVYTPARDGGKQTSHARAGIMQQALSNAGFVMTNGDHVMLRPSKREQEEVARVEIVRP